MNIRYEVRDNICTIVMDRSPTNALDIGFLREFDQTLQHIDETKNIKVVILSSAHKQLFSSGLDLRSLTGSDSSKTADNIIQAVGLVGKIVDKIVSSGKVFIASVPGAAIGSAASIVFSCDLCMGTARTWFWLPDPQYGGLLADGGFDILTKLIGVSRTKMIALTNERLNAQRALEWGLIYKLAGCDQLDRAVFSEAKRICSYSGCTLGLTKKLINSDLLGSFEEEALRSVLKNGDFYTRLNKYISI